MLVSNIDCERGSELFLESFDLFIYLFYLQTASCYVAAQPQVHNPPSPASNMLAPQGWINKCKLIKYLRKRVCMQMSINDIWQKPVDLHHPLLVPVPGIISWSRNTFLQDFLMASGTWPCSLSWNKWRILDLSLETARSRSCTYKAGRSGLEFNQAVCDPMWCDLVCYTYYCYTNKSWFNEHQRSGTSSGRNCGGKDWPWMETRGPAEVRVWYN